ncbi:hypothetical protein ACFLSV_02300 [Bacteroidota bacterium]
MIFKIITNAKHRKEFKLLTYLLVFSFVLTISGCTTTETQRVSANNISYKVDYEIVNVIMKDGLLINLRDKSARFEKEYDDKKNVIVYRQIDTVRVTERSYKVYAKTNVIELDNVQEVTIEKSEIDVGLTILVTVGIIAVIAIIILIAAANSSPEMKCKKPCDGSLPPVSCPFIYSFDGEKYVFDAEPYGGAITEGMKETDYTRLNHLKPVEGKYKILVRNDADETQHTDEMKLLVIDHAVNTEVAQDMNNNMVTYKKIHAPLSVTNENGKDITSTFTSKDDYKWQSILPKDSLSIGNKLRHKLTLKFLKPKNAKNVKLLVNAGTSMWGGYVIKSMLELQGNKVDEWYKNVNNYGTELLKVNQFIEKEEVYILKVNVFENNNWVVKGYIPSAGGPFFYQDRILDLNLENIPGDTFTVELNPPYGFWKIDQVGVIYDEYKNIETNEFSLCYAKDQDGNDLVKSLDAIDRDYYTMPEMGEYAYIHFNVPPQKKGTKRTIYLKTNGYYDIHLKKDLPDQTKLYEKILDTPGLIVKFAMSEYFKTINKYLANQ